MLDGNFSHEFSSVVHFLVLGLYFSRFSSQNIKDSRSISIANELVVDHKIKIDQPTKLKLASYVQHVGRSVFEGHYVAVAGNLVFNDAEVSQCHIFFYFFLCVCVCSKINTNLIDSCPK